MEILLFNAYHWNPCWKVDEQCCISGCLRFVSTKNTNSDFTFPRFDSWLCFGHLFIYVTVGFLRSPCPLVVCSLTMVTLGGPDCRPIGQGMRGCVSAQFCTKALWLVEKITFCIRHNKQRTPKSNWFKYIEMLLKSWQIICKKKVILLWKHNGDSQKCYSIHLLFNKDSNGKH